MNPAMRKDILFTILTAFTLAACGSGSEEKGPEAKALEMRGRIAAMEDTLFNSTGFDQRGAQELLDVYKAYVAAFPVDSMAPEYLFRAAGVSKVLYDGHQGIFLYDRIVQDYGGWERIPDVMYMKAFTLDSELGMKGEAKEAYQQVIYKYPDHPFAKDARVMMDNLEYTDAELIERFKAQQEEADAAAAAGR